MLFRGPSAGGRGRGASLCPSTATTVPEGPPARPRSLSGSRTSSPFREPSPSPVSYFVPSTVLFPSAPSGPRGSSWPSLPQVSPPSLCPLRIPPTSAPWAPGLFLLPSQPEAPAAGPAGTGRQPLVPSAPQRVSLTRPLAQHEALAPPPGHLTEHAAPPTRPGTAPESGATHSATAATGQGRRGSTEPRNSLPPPRGGRASLTRL